jgi:hypothetical protein
MSLVAVGNILPVVEAARLEALEPGRVLDLLPAKFSDQIRLLIVQIRAGLGFEDAGSSCHSLAERPPAARRRRHRGAIAERGIRGVRAEHLGLGGGRGAAQLKPGEEECESKSCEYYGTHGFTSNDYNSVSAFDCKSVNGMT